MTNARTVYGTPDIMENFEIHELAASLKRRLELLMEAGITGIPKAAKAGAGQGECPSDWVLFQGSLDEAQSVSPCGHQDWKGLLFGLWRLGGAAIIWGVPVTGASLGDGPFGEAISQLEKMLAWLSGEIKADMPEMRNPQAVLATRCPRAGKYTDAEAAVHAASAIMELAEGSKAALLMGPLAAWGILKEADLKASRGKVHREGALKAVVTWGPDDLLKEQGLKKEAHSDLKLLISSLGD